MYKLTPISTLTNKSNSVFRLSDRACIPFAVDNSDFAQFKKDLTDGADLQDADGNTMTTEEVTEFIATLP